MAEVMGSTSVRMKLMVHSLILIRFEQKLKIISLKHMLFIFTCVQILTVHLLILSLSLAEIGI